MRVCLFVQDRTLNRRSRVQAQCQSHESVDELIGHSSVGQTNSTKNRQIRNGRRVADSSGMGEGVTNIGLYTSSRSASFRLVLSCFWWWSMLLSWREDKRWKGLWMTGDQQYTRANLPPTTQHKHTLRACMVCVSCHAQSYGHPRLTSEIYPPNLAPFFDDRRRSLASSTRI